MEKKKLLFGQLNSDNGDYTLPDSHYLNASNINIFTPENSNVGDIEAVVGNQKVTDTPIPLTENAKIIGTTTNEAKGRIIYIVLDEGQSWIFAYDKNDSTIYMVFDFQDFIDGTVTYSENDFISSMVVKGDFLIWTLDGHPPYKINIERGISRYDLNYVPPTSYAPYVQFRTPKDIEVAKQAPNHPPYLDFEWTSGIPDAEITYNELFWIYGGETNLLGNESYMFATRFVYNDGDISVMSPYSKIAQPKADNAIGIRVHYSPPNVTSVPYDVKYVELIAKYGNDGEAFIINRASFKQYGGGYFDFYNRESRGTLSDDYVSKDFEAVPLESSTVEAVNNRIVFGGNKEGYETPSNVPISITPHYVGDDYTGDWFKDIPFVATNENTKLLATDKLWGADGSSSDLLRAWSSSASVVVYLNSSIISPKKRGWYLIPQDLIPKSYYSEAKVNVAGWASFWSSATYRDFIFLGAQEEDLITGISGTEWNDDGYYVQRYFSVISNFTSLSATTVIPNYPYALDKIFKNKEIIYKTGTEYQYGIIFSDESKRKSLTYVGDIMSTPPLTHNMLTYKNGAYDKRYVRYAEWSIPDVNPPEWASNYKIVRSDPDVSMFYQFKATDISYAYKNYEYKGNDIAFNYHSTYDNLRKTFFNGKIGEWTLLQGEPKSFVSAIAIPLVLLNKKNIGYTFSEGDYIRVIRQDLEVSFKSKIIEVSGGYVFCEYTNIGEIEILPFVKNDVFTGKDVEGISADTMYESIPYEYTCEIVTPKIKGSGNFYEVSEVFNISRDSWGSVTGTMDTLSGKIRGDVYVENINGSYSEVANRGDKWNKWEVDNMRPNATFNFEENFSFSKKETSIKWGGNYINGTQINNLSSFNALDEEILSGEIGAIQKLVFTNKISDYGKLLLVIGTKATLSIYIGETILTDTEGSENVQKSTNFIGTIRELKGNYGTMHPESVAKYRGNVYWWDAGHNSVIRYSSAGLYPISNYYMKSFFNKLNTKDEKMFGGYDPYSEEYVLRIPAFSRVAYIEYPNDWNGLPVCEDNTVTGWGDGFTAEWGDYTCVKLGELGFSATWDDFICVKEGLSFDFVTWGDYTCAKQDLSKVFRVVWGDYICVKTPETFNVSWADFVCVQINDTGSYTAQWDQKVCVNIVT